MVVAKSTPRAIEVRERQDRVLHKRRMGLTWQQITDEEGYPNTGTTYHAWEAALNRQPSADAKAVRASEMGRLETLEAELWDLYRRDAVVVSNGKVMRDETTGTLLVDLGPKLTALLQLRQLGESRRKLVGADAPTRKIVEVVTEDVIEGEIRRLTEKLGVNDPAVTGVADAS